jgi:hypothetical protein
MVLASRQIEESATRTRSSALMLLKFFPPCIGLMPFHAVGHWLWCEEIASSSARP